MNSPTELTSGAVLKGRYQVSDLIAIGETNYVYEGRHIGLDLPIVIKQLREIYPDPRQAEEQAKLYHAQAQLLGRFRHPNLVTVYDTFEYQDRPTLVTEKIEGHSIKEIIELAPEPLPEHTILNWTAQLIDLLEFLHSQSKPVIVRGLAPTNIILDRQQTLQIVDFGLAKSMDYKGAGTQNILKGLGEEGFAPIEQFAYSKTDERSDLYSLGALLYYVTTGQVPPSASQRIISPEDPLKVPEHSPLKTAITGLMKLRAQDRPQSVREARSLFPKPITSRRCVDCNVVLLIESLDGVEIDRCLDCGGIWLDKGELETLRDLYLKEMERLTVRQDELSAQTPPASESSPSASQSSQKDSPFWSAIKRLIG